MEDFTFSIYSDEAYVCLGDERGRVFVTRRPGEEFDEECIVPSFKQSSVCIMIWGCIIMGRKGPLVVLDYSGGRGGGMTAARYQTQVLDGALRDFYDEVVKERGCVDFQHDGAASHRAKSTRRWFDEARIPLLDHPAQSPDLNPIEPVWHDMKAIICSIPSINTVEQLKDAARAAWDQILIEKINGHISQMPDRVQAVLEAKGGHTRF